MALVVVKVQRPLSIDGGEWLVYDQSRMLVALIEPTIELIAKMGERDKAYFNAERVGGTFHIHDRVEDQRW